MKWKKKSERKRIDVLNDIEEIEDFLHEVPDDNTYLQKLIKQLDELEKERKVAKDEILKTNLTTQAKVFDDLLKRFEFLVNDAAINGERLKIIKDQFLKHATKAGLHDLVRERRKDQTWKCRW